jgi:Na+-translocating ferredoxin:NAD+ oxidoreductase RnfC subunit
MLGVNVDLSSVADQPPTVARVHENRCVGCTKCLKRCPTDAIMAGPKMMHAIFADACTWVPLPSTWVPVVKGNNGVLALTAEEVNARPPTPCIRGASCVGACPCGLLPLEMAAHARVGDLEGAVRLGLLDCIGCSCCAYVCPPPHPPGAVLQPRQG